MLSSLYEKVNRKHAFREANFTANTLVNLRHGLLSVPIEHELPMAGLGQKGSVYNVLIFCMSKIRRAHKIIRFVFGSQNHAHLTEKKTPILKQRSFQAKITIGPLLAVVGALTYPILHMLGVECG